MTSLTHYDNKEEIILGKGIGFGLKKGDTVNQAKIQRRFVTANDQLNFDQVKDISASTIDIINEVMKLVEPLLKIKFNDFQYLFSRSY